MVLSPRVLLEGTSSSPSSPTSSPDLIPVSCIFRAAISATATAKVALAAVISATNLVLVSEIAITRLRSAAVLWARLARWDADSCIIALFAAR